jgi:hypothetical protein
MSGVVPSEELSPSTQNPADASLLQVKCKAHVTLGYCLIEKAMYPPFILPLIIGFYRLYEMIRS